MLICSVCKEEKEETEFFKKKTSKTGYQSKCKVCERKINRQWYKNNPEKIREKSKRYFERNKEKIREYDRERRPKDEEKLKAYRKQWNEENREKRKEYGKRYQKENKEKVNEYHRKWNANNKDKKKEYDLKHREAHREWRREYTKQEHVKFKQRSNAKLNREVKNGNIVKPENCSICGKIGKVESHHYDYNKPLEVVWVCRKCHVAIHKSLKERK